MGAPSTKTIGGGSATPVANQWNDFLGSQLPGANMGGAQGSNMPQMPNIIMNNMSPQMRQQYQNMMNNQGNTLNKTEPSGPTPFTSAIDGLLSGSSANPNMQNWLAGQNGNGMANINPISQQADYNLNAPQFATRDLNPINTNPLNFQSANFSQHQNSPSNFGVDPNVAGALSRNFSPNQVSGGAAGMDFSMPAPNQISFDQNSDIANAAAGGMERTMQRALADSRARASAGGGSSLGTSAITERAMTMAEMAPQIQNMRLQANALANQQGMQNYGQNTGLMLQNRGLESGFNLNNAGLGLQGQMANQQAGLQGMGQGIQAALGLGGLQNSANSLNLQGIGQNNQAINAQNNLNLNQAQGLNQNNLSQLLGLGQLGLGQNQQQIQQQGMQNDFNLNSFNSQNNAANLANTMNANIGQMNNQNSMQNQQMGNQWQGMLGSLMQGMDAQRQQGIMNIVNQLFGSMQQSNAIGNPQAQTVQNPSTLGQIAGLAGTISGIPGIGSIFGGGSSAPQGQMINNATPPQMMNFNGMPISTMVG